MTEILLPRLDVNETEATIKAVFVHTGDRVKPGQPLVEVETTKAVETIESPEEGYVQVLVKEGEVHPYGTVLVRIFESREALDRALQEAPASEEEATEPGVKATRKAVEKARELGIDLRQIPKKGVILEKDVVAFYEKETRKPAEIRRPTPRFRYDLERVVIIGAGRGAEVVVDILAEDPDKMIVGLVDDRVTEFPLFNLPVIFHSVRAFPLEFDRNAYDTVIVSIGANLKTMQIRHEIFTHYREHGVRFTNAIARSAELRRGVQLGEGNIIGGQVYIGASTRIGHNNLISYGAKVGHHNIVGDSNLIAPGVVTSGSVKIGTLCILSAGVTVINRVEIGDRVVLPVGYAVTRDLPSGTLIKMEG